jgi:hypothetical protein
MLAGVCGGAGAPAPQRAEGQPNRRERKA